MNDRIVTGGERGALKRRLVTVPAVVLGLPIGTLLLPPLLALGLLVDLGRIATGRRHLVSVRLLLIGWWYLLVTTVALGLLLIAWVVTGFGRLRHLELEITYRLQSWWAAMLFGAFRIGLSLRLEVEDDEVVLPGPILLLMRHASIVDTLVPSALVTRRHGLRLRYVMKKELLNEPAIDIAGNRLVNYFVHRGSGDAGGEVARVRGLSAGLTEREGVLIYPEGTRFTAEKQAKVLASLERRDPGLAERARRLRHVLPPRLGGPVALLDPLTPSDVVFLAHVGFDGLATVRDLWAGTIVGSTIRAAFWRVPKEEIPAGERERVEWLYEQWARVDDWIHAAKAGA